MLKGLDHNHNSNCNGAFIFKPYRTPLINSYHRYQVGLTMNELYPDLRNICACGCQNELPRNRKKWFTDSCRNTAYRQFAVIKGDLTQIRQQVFERDRGFCRMCGVKSDSWQADHIHPVYMGGGGCSLSNFQTLCIDCHKSKTNYNLSHHIAISSQATSILFSLFLKEEGQHCIALAKTSNEKQSLLLATCPSTSKISVAY